MREVGEGGAQGEGCVQGGLWERGQGQRGTSSISQQLLGYDEEGKVREVGERTRTGEGVCARGFMKGGGAREGPVV